MREGEELSPRGFTLVEMLVSMVVLAVSRRGDDPLSRVPSPCGGQRSRTNACREARAALTVMTRDLSNAVLGTNVNL